MKYKDKYNPDRRNPSCIVCELPVSRQNLYCGVSCERADYEGTVALDWSWATAQDVPFRIGETDVRNEN